jgi:hypothetical protein
MEWSSGKNQLYTATEKLSSEATDQENLGRMKGKI